MDELKKIDLIRQRMDVSFSAAREALLKADGDVVGALVELEKGRDCWSGKIGEHSRNMWGCVRNMFHQGRNTRIKIKRNGETLMTIPASFGLLAMAGILSSEELTFAAGIGTAAALLKGCHLEVLRQDEETEEEFIIIS